MKALYCSPPASGEPYQTLNGETVKAELAAIHGENYSIPHPEQKTLEADRLQGLVRSGKIKDPEKTSFLKEFSQFLKRKPHGNDKAA